MSLATYTKEFSYNLRLAYPIILGMLGHTVVGIVDNVMVGKLGPAELAAVSLANSFVFIAMSLGIGFSTAITPLAAEADGEQNIEKGRSVFSPWLVFMYFFRFFSVCVGLFCQTVNCFYGTARSCGGFG